MKRAELLTVIMHDIGLPVIEGVIQVALSESEEKVVEDVTRLLRQTIENADDIRGLLDLAEKEDKDVSVRLNLATLSCHIIAAHYKRTGSLPTQAELKRTVSSVDQLLTFSENYIPMESLDDVFPENIRGLSPLSRTVANLVYLKYFVPLVDAISDFSFGEDEARMIQKVSEKLRLKASEITNALMEETLSAEEKKSAELLILSSLVPLYCSCHYSEKKRITGLDEDTRAKEDNKTQIENIWLLFDKRLSMLTVMAKHIMPDHFSDEDIAKIDNIFSETPKSVGKDPVEEIKNLETLLSQKEKSQEKQPASKSLSGGPMSFFSLDDNADEFLEAGGAASEAQEEKQELMSVTDKAESVQESKETKENEDSGKDEEKSSGKSGNPMSFFS